MLDKIKPELNRLIWIDLEMTGLDPVNDVIIEIATIVTDAELKVIAEGPSLVIKQPDEFLDGMDAWNTRQHGQSGLTRRVRDSEISVAGAERQTLEFLSTHLQKNESPMCGNSICQDRRFLAKGMPELEAFFHYRNLDVSTLKELARRWKPSILEGMKKNSSHLALDDIRDSIEELRYYRSKLLDL